MTPTYTPPTHAEVVAWESKTIKAAHTKQLLKWIDAARRCGGSYSPVDSSSAFQLTFEALKAELDTREHVPNKVENKAIIKARKASGVSRKKK